jgi:hypothetical protein
MRSVALAAGTIAETMNIQQSTRSDHPAKKPAVLPKTILTHAYEVPAFGDILFKLIKESAIPNMMRPQTRILAGERRPAMAMMVEVVISMLYAGAVPAIPIIVDSTSPKEFFAKSARLFSWFMVCIY